MRAFCPNARSQFQFTEPETVEIGWLMLALGRSPCCRSLGYPVVFLVLDDHSASREASVPTHAVGSRGNTLLAGLLQCESRAMCSLVAGTDDKGEQCHGSADDNLRSAWIVQ